MVSSDAIGQLALGLASGGRDHFGYLALVCWLLALAVLGLWHLTALVTRWWHCEPKPKPPRNPRPLEETLRAEVRAARQRYELNCELIRSAGLEEEEEWAALTRARQNLMRHLNRVVG